jgi:hypothetical protein
MMKRLDEKTIRVGSPRGDHIGRRADSLEDAFRPKCTRETEYEGKGQRYVDRLPGGPSRLFRVLFADTPGDQGGCGHAKPDGDRIHDRNGRFRQADGSHCRFSELAYKKYIDDGENGLHAHFEDHGNGQ